MKRNPVIPYAIIAVLGILMVIVISFVGMNQADEIANEGKENGKEQKSEEGGGGESANAGDPEAIFQNNCASCHGGDLSGGVGPDLTQVGGRYSKEEIKDIVINGIEGTQMPGGLVPEKEADALATWLAEKK